MPSKPPKCHSVFSGASDWIFLFDLGNSFAFPSHIAITSRRPDAVFYSNSLKRVVLLELTVPIEDRVLKSQQLKTRRYDALVKECASNGWRASLLTIEVGCRGYACGSIKHVLMQLGLSRAMANQTLCACSDVSLRCSNIIYLIRSIPL